VIIPPVWRRLLPFLFSHYNSTEVGSEGSRFPSASHLASWAGVRPDNHEGAGKRKSGRTNPGSPALKRALVVATQGASRRKDTYISAQFHRLAARRGSEEAVLALAHSILKIAYHLLREPQEYYESESNHCDLLKKVALEKRLLQRLEGFGYRVSLERAPLAA
jgi:transposase